MFWVWVQYHNIHRDSPYIIRRQFKLFLEVWILEDPSTDRKEDLAPELGLALEVFSGVHRDPWEPGLEVLGYRLLELGPGGDALVF